MTTTFGTCNFVDRSAALRYYGAYGYSGREVDELIASKGIELGKPAVKDGERLSLIDRGTRYAITTSI